MKTIEELRAYYETDLLPTLTVLDRARKKVLFELFVGIVISVIAPIIALYFSFGSVVLMAICFPVLIGVIIYLSISIGKYKKSFKVGIIEQIVRAIDPNLSYDAFNAAYHDAVRGSTNKTHRVEVRFAKQDALKP